MQNMGPAPGPSVPAILSLVFGLVSPLLFCTCVGPFVFSLVAVVLGHIAQVQIGRSAGRLTGWGIALAGLILGYLGLLCYVAYFGLAFSGAMNANRGIVAGGAAYNRSPLDDVESAIDTDSKGIAHGNDDQAKKLAERFAQIMEQKHDESFTKVKTRIQLSGGHYVTWCELHAGRCAFVVHVPQYRKFSDDAKEHLNALAWQTAQEVVQETLRPGDELAIGLKGAFLYGGVLVGSVGEPTPDSTGKDKEVLAPFLEADLNDNLPGAMPSNDLTIKVTPAEQEQTANPAVVEPLEPDLEPATADSAE